MLHQCHSLRPQSVACAQVKRIKLAAFTRHLRLQVRAIKRVRRTHPVKTSANRHSECVVDLGDFTAALFEFFAGDRGLSLSLCAPVGINGSYAGRDKLGHLFHDAVFFIRRNT
jgi:hypothetical protein